VEQINKVFPPHNPGRDYYETTTRRTWFLKTPVTFKALQKLPSLKGSMIARSSSTKSCYWLTARQTNALLALIKAHNPDLPITAAPAKTSKERIP
jgi:hypothetical protein